MLVRLVQHLLGAIEPFNDEIVDKQLLAIQDNCVAQDTVIQLFDQSGRRLERLGVGAGKSD